MKVDLLNMIPHGKQNAITCRELSKLSGVSERNIKAFISNVRRKHGLIICAVLDTSNGSSGYFKPETLAELAEYCKIEQARIDTEQEALNPALKAMREGRII